MSAELREILTNALVTSQFHRYLSMLKEVANAGQYSIDDNYSSDRRQRGRMEKVQMLRILKQAELVDSKRKVYDYDTTRRPSLEYTLTPKAKELLEKIKHEQWLGRYEGIDY
jgi:beta-phosphoglucomutase-like phosphatase (HAD superfamily)